MSRVIRHSKKIYQRAILAESLILIIFYVGIVLFNYKFALPFFLGFFVAFISQLGFIGYIFYFVEKKSIQDRVKLLYQSEALKIGLNIFLFALLFLWFKPTQPIVFFVGYLIAIVCNSTLPFFFSRLNRLV
ncbi:hypothetical protein CEP49_05665 [Mergibacter septicus]|uniref:ATP synthase subunit I n=1 Tax=Mergibacter septicus TaxID=221402 RepID=UPI0011790B16|nr:ATP synthase subunit I [Mergibacter septicus]AWX14073.1 hypothetical protein CEP49_05665 [Mergibacter septicus]